jgi:diguanylate cyclase
MLRPASVDITVSIGLACTTDFPDADLTKLTSHADKALYAAKERGRNRVCLATPQGNQDMPEAVNQ